MKDFQFFEVSLIPRKPFPMPGNVVKVTINGSDELEWYVGDSKMEPLLDYLGKQGSPVGHRVSLEDFKVMLGHKPSINELLTHPFEEVRQLASYLLEAMREEFSESKDGGVSEPS